MIDPSEVQQEITTKITELTPAESYRQSTSDTWRESTTPIVPEYDPEPAAHLVFFVDDRKLQSIPTPQNDFAPILFTGPVTIRFLFRIRPNNRTADWKNSSKALMALIRHLLAWQPDEFDFSLDPSTADRRVIGDGSFMACELRLQVEFQTTSV